MEYILTGVKQAIGILISPNREVVDIVFLSLRVSATAAVFACLVGVPLGFAMAIHDFKGKRVLIIVLNSLLAIPTVVVGLVVYSLLSHRGPLGFLELLYTPWAIIFGEFILVTPIISALSFAALQSVDKRTKDTARSLGANNFQVALTLFRETKFSLLAAIILGFGRAISEVGSAIIVGGNIKGSTRTLTTAIALETSKGEFALGIALGIILLTIALSVSILFQYLQGKS